MEVSGRRTTEDDAADGQTCSETEEVYCQPCSSDGDFVIAKGYCKTCNEFFCTACFRPHRKQSATKNHVILDGSNMPKSLSIDVQVETCSELCTKHDAEIVKFYCPSHDLTGCSDCMVLEHKVCTVERIQDISGTFFNSQEHKMLVIEVDKFLARIEKVKHNIQVTEEDIKATYTQVVADIKAFRKEIDDFLDKAEADILSEVNKRKTEDERAISQVQADLFSLQNEIIELEKKLNLESKRANELFVSAKQMATRKSTFDKTITEMSQKSRREQYMFEKSSKLSASFNFPLGKLENRNEHHDKKITEMEPHFRGEIEIKDRKDKSDCCIIASTLISSSQLVLADFNNKCIKLVDLNKNVLQERYELPSKPFDVTGVGENLVAVTLTDIQILNVEMNGSFSKSLDIRTSGSARKIAHSSGTLIVGYTDRLELMDKNGSVFHQITFPNLNWIASISVSSDSKAFLVSNSGMKVKPTAVYKFDFDGNVLATYEDKTLSDVRGLTVTPDGTFLVCNWVDNGSVHMISPDCKKVKEILQHSELVKKPYSISFCDQTNTLVLCCYAGSLGPKMNNFLKRFNMN